jgi:hypothetical protein
MVKKIIIAIFILTLLSIVPGGVPVTTVTADPFDCGGDYCYFLPSIRGPLSYYRLPIIAYNIPESALIINHNNIDITQIPDQWLTAARQLTIHYGQTSHGSQILSGLDYLETYINGTKYAYAISEGGTPPSLPAGTNLLKMYTGNNYDGDTYVTPDMYWDGTDGVNHTYSTAATGLFDYSMWSWCGQADSASGYINEYLVQMSAFNNAFPNMRFILMTGHNVSPPATNLLARNQQIRNYAIAHDMVLFDFADIETYTPDGIFYNPTKYNYNDGDCPWCDSWCASHASYCANLDQISCAHTHPLFCKMKAQAFWWMMARLAGWTGQ